MRKMKPTAFIVNTARGSIIDQVYLRVPYSHMYFRLYAICIRCTYARGSMIDQVLIHVPYSHMRIYIFRTHSWLLYAATL